MASLIRLNVAEVFQQIFLLPSKVEMTFHVKRDLILWACNLNTPVFRNEMKSTVLYNNTKGFKQFPTKNEVASDGNCTDIGLIAISSDYWANLACAS